GGGRGAPGGGGPGTRCKPPRPPRPGASPASTSAATAAKAATTTASTALRCAGWEGGNSAARKLPATTTTKPTAIFASTPRNAGAPARPPTDDTSRPVGCAAHRTPAHQVRKPGGRHRGPFADGIPTALAPAWTRSLRA